MKGPVYTGPFFYCDIIAPFLPGWILGSYRYFAVKSLTTWVYSLGAVT